MDVIALHQAGFAGAVAPLGTALTAEQLQALWQVSPEPVLCFDGDAAGGRAAAKATEVALPLLAPERSLRLATLPSGEDPDSLVKSQGPRGFEAVLDAAQPLSEALFGLIAGTKLPETPEARAAIRNRLAAAAQAIPDRSLAAEYRRSLLDRYFAQSKRPGGKAPSRHARPTPDADEIRAQRARILLAVALHHPFLLPDVEEPLALLDFPAGAPRQLRDAILAWLPAAPRLDSAELITHLAQSGVAVDWVLCGTGLPAEAGTSAQPKEALDAFWQIFGYMRGEVELVDDLERARAAWVETNDAAAQTRLIRLAGALDALRRGEADEPPEGAGSAAK